MLLLLAGGAGGDEMSSWYPALDLERSGSPRYTVRLPGYVGYDLGRLSRHQKSWPVATWSLDVTLRRLLSSARRRMVGWVVQQRWASSVTQLNGVGGLSLRLFQLPK